MSRQTKYFSSKRQSVVVLLLLAILGLGQILMGWRGFQYSAEEVLSYLNQPHSLNEIQTAYLESNDIVAIYQKGITINGLVILVGAAFVLASMRKG